MEQQLIITYVMKAEDEFGRVFDTHGRIDARYLFVKHEADALYVDMLIALATPILYRMGTDASAEWYVEVTDELIET